MTPEIHATLLGGSSILSLVLSVTILARNPRSTSARMHAVYGGIVAWWLFSMAMIASSDGPESLRLWSRLVHIAVAMLPGVAFHLNVVAAGLSGDYRRSVRLHYALSGVMIVFVLAWPSLFSTPHVYAWGPYPSYTAWGILPVGFLIITLVEVWMMYQAAIRRAEPGTAFRHKARALARGNLVAALAVVDFLPVFGVGIYPPGLVIMPTMLAVTLFGAIRYELIEITPEFAAEQILRILPDGVLVVDSKGTIRLANESVAQALGHPPGGLIGQRLETVCPGSLASACLAVADGLPANEVLLDSCDGQGLVVALSGATLRDQAGKAVGRLCVLHDLTAQRQAEAEVDKLEGWVRHSQKLETLGVMAGGVAHDFNNLLAVILGNAEIASLKLEDDEPIDEQLLTIVSAAERGSELTRQMLRFAGEGTTRKAPVDLSALCSETLELLKTAISKKARLEVDLAADLPLVIADKGNINQVILNLVANASDALNDEVGVIAVRTALLEADESSDDPESASSVQVILEVRDTGCGMDPDTKSRIFDPFFTTKFAGRGLGLANVMGIVQAHGGRIRVDTEPGVGSCFTFALPAAPQAGAATENSEVAEQEKAGSGVALVADDEPAVRKIVSFVLRRSGFEVVEAANGREAVDLYQARQTEISVVLLDMTMPEMDGREALARIRALSFDVPVVLMSGYTETSSEDLAPGRSPALLSKPFRTDGLTRKVQEAMAEVGSE